MRIAQIAPLHESVPPQCYGGTERVVSYLTEELIRQGHDVTLFATGDSVTSARLVAPCNRALRFDSSCVDRSVHHILMLELIWKKASEFDIVHSHVDYIHFPMFRRLEVPHVTTLHGRLDIPDLVPLYKEFRDIPLVSISDAQRAPLWWANWQATVYHGLPEDLLDFHPARGTYLAFLGRISPEKRVDRAIEIARRVDMPIKIAAKVDKADGEYFEEVVKPLFSDSRVEYVGEITEVEKNEFLGDAYALLFPIDWPEPFGLVMIEAMACGTPVVAFRRGSVPEVMVDGVTGFVVEDLDEAVEAVDRVASLDRREVRRVFEDRFTAERMAREYVNAYNRLIRQFGSEREVRRMPLPIFAPSLNIPPSGADFDTLDTPADLGRKMNVPSTLPGVRFHTGGSFQPKVRKPIAHPKS